VGSTLRGTELLSVVACQDQIIARCPSRQNVTEKARLSVIVKNDSHQLTAWVRLSLVPHQYCPTTSGPPVYEISDFHKRQRFDQCSITAPQACYRIYERRHGKRRAPGCPGWRGSDSGAVRVHARGWRAKDPHRAAVLLRPPRATTLPTEWSMVESQPLFGNYSRQDS